MHQFRNCRRWWQRPWANGLIVEYSDRRRSTSTTGTPLGTPSRRDGKQRAALPRPEAPRVAPTRSWSSTTTTRPAGPAKAYYPDADDQWQPGLLQTFMGDQGTLLVSESELIAPVGFYCSQSERAGVGQWIQKGYVSAPKELEAKEQTESSERLRTYASRWPRTNTPSPCRCAILSSSRICRTARRPSAARPRSTVPAGIGLRRPQFSIPCEISKRPSTRSAAYRSRAAIQGLPTYLYHEPDARSKERASLCERATRPGARRRPSTRSGRGDASRTTEAARESACRGVRGASPSGLGYEADMERRRRSGRAGGGSTRQLRVLVGCALPLQKASPVRRPRRGRRRVLSNRPRTAGRGNQLLARAQGRPARRDATEVTMSDLHDCRRLLMLGLFTPGLGQPGRDAFHPAVLSRRPAVCRLLLRDAGEGSYLVVNENLVELAALVVILFTRSGRFAGLDGMDHGLMRRRPAAGRRPRGAEVARIDSGGFALCSGGGARVARDIRRPMPTDRRDRAACGAFGTASSGNRCGPRAIGRDRQPLPSRAPASEWLNRPRRR